MKKTLTLALLASVLLLGAPPAHAALSDTLGSASAVEYIFAHPKPTGPSRRVVVAIPDPGTGTGGSLRTERWDGTSWVLDVSTVTHVTDAALDTAIGIARQRADGLNTSEETAQLLTDAATAVRDRLLGLVSNPPTVEQLATAIGGQTVFDISRK